MTVRFDTLNILLVDDEQFIRQLVARLLRDMGVHDVIMAQDGEDALTKLATASGRINLIILDLEMPNMNGFQVVQKVRNGSANVPADLPIIILTGHGKEEAVKAAVSLGVHGYLVKPMSKGDLEKRIIVAMGSGTIDPKILGN